MPNPHVNSLGFELRGNLRDVGLAVVVGEQHFGFDGFGRANELVGGHGVGLVAGQEGDVDAQAVVSPKIAIRLAIIFFIFFFIL